MAVEKDDIGKKVKMILGPEQLTQATYKFKEIDPNGHCVIICIESSDDIILPGFLTRTTLKNLNPL